MQPIEQLVNQAIKTKIKIETLEVKLSTQERKISNQLKSNELPHQWVFQKQKNHLYKFKLKLPLSELTGFLAFYEENGFSFHQRNGWTKYEYFMNGDSILKVKQKSDYARVKARLLVEDLELLDYVLANT